MKTPIIDFLEEYNGRDTSRLHMPGHKGKGALGVEGLDITEIAGADELYASRGIIKESRECASRLFGSGASFYATEGSSQCVRAMLYLALTHLKSIGKEPVFLAARNAHKSFVGAAALLGIEPIWLYGNENGGILSCSITEEALDTALEEAGGRIGAVYLTSPDYLGNTLPIERFSKIVKKHGALLLVDNAHGAYRAFLPENCHPMACGADMCCDSAHKTLPALTGAAYLHISKSAPKMLAERAEEALAIFGTTSPSYLIMASLDSVNAYIESGYRERLAAFSERVFEMKKRLMAAGYELVGDECLKISIATKSYGYLGEELSRILQENGIFVEFFDRDFLVMMLSPEMKFEETDRLMSVLLSIKRREAITEEPPRSPRGKKRMPPRDAMLSPSEEISVSLSRGRVLATVSVSCPPAVPIAVYGEEITEEAVSLFEYYNIKTCRVVKE